jgi:phage gp36-like protein
MSYCTEANLITQYGIDELIQLTDRTDSGLVDSAVVSAALDAADAEIDSYLAVRYTLPLATVPAVVVQLAGVIARYRLHDDREIPVVRKNYEDAVDSLKRLAKGSMVLIGAGSNAAPALGQSATPSSRINVFTDTVMARMWP